MKNILESIKTQNKIRGINKYTNQLISADETLNFILKCYKMVSENFKIVNSQYEFSKIFLDCNRYYYGKIKCEKKSPSLNCIATLIKNIQSLQQLSSNNDVNNQQLNALYLEGKKLIYKKLLL